MIRSFADGATEDIFDDRETRQARSPGGLEFRIRGSMKSSVASEA